MKEDEFEKKVEELRCKSKDIEVDWKAIKEEKLDELRKEDRIEAMYGDINDLDIEHLADEDD